jgi:hypothetical protein
VFAWRITQTRDPLGNLIRYDYLRDRGEQAGHVWDQPLVSHICYADYGDRAAPSFLVSVEFDYEPRPDSCSEYRAGFEIRTSLRCRAIRVATHAADGVTRPVREYRFTYRQAAFNGASLLARIDAIQAAGLATCSSRGTLIDRFRDRIMLPVHDAAGLLAGFTGRANPGAGPDTPKYLNSPQTATYKKSHLLFGLSQARPALARGAVPVIVEGAFDAIAISIADPGRHAGLAPCGTALTCEQAAQLSQAADLPRTGSPSRSTPTPPDAKPPSAPTASSARSPASSSQSLSTARTPPRSCNGTARRRSGRRSSSWSNRCHTYAEVPASRCGCRSASAGS